MGRAVELMEEQIQTLAISLVTLSDAVIGLLNFERRFEDGEWNRAGLEKAAQLRKVYFTDNTCDYDLYSGIKSSMRADLININGIIRDKIKTNGGESF